MKRKNFNITATLGLNNHSSEIIITTTSGLNLNTLAIIIVYSVSVNNENYMNNNSN